MAARTTPFGSGHAVDGRQGEIQAHRTEIEEQLGRILASPLFKNSKHYPALLRYVVEQTLNGTGAHLKERALGVEVFGRLADYDTNLDPVVRTSACEVRKRIAQYYHDHAHEHELRIDLPSGSYVPEFHFPEPVAVATVVPVPAAPAPAALVSRRVAAMRQLRAHPVFAGLVVALLAIGAATASLRGGKSALDQFWGPVWGASDGVLVCLGGKSGIEAAKAALAQTDAAGATPTALEVMRYDRIAFSDALTMGRLFNVIRSHGKRYDVRRGASVTLTDLRRGPVILIGAFNNGWTMCLKKHLRFTFERENGAADGAMLIRDTQNPSDRRWRIDQRVAYNKLAEDFAVVSRVLDPMTERIVVTVAGMTKDGTLAAGEFVTEEHYLAALAAKAPRGWERKNVQVVLGTDLIDGVPGPPRILATWFW